MATKVILENGNVLNLKHKFDGQLYTLTGKGGAKTKPGNRHQLMSKADALKVAEGIRRKKRNARVVPSGNRYLVYAR